MRAAKSANLTALQMVPFCVADRRRGHPGPGCEIEQPHIAEGGDEKTQPNAQRQGSQRVFHQQSPGVPTGAPASRGLQVCCLPQGMGSPPQFGGNHADVGASRDPHRLLRDIAPGIDKHPLPPPLPYLSYCTQLLIANATVYF